MRLSEFLTRDGRFRGVFFDIDGTLLTAGKLCPNAAELIGELRQRNFPHYLLTNDANHSREEKSSFLRRAGLPVAPTEIISCGSALRPLVRERAWEGRRFFILGDLGNPCFARAAGLKTSRDLQELDDCFGVIVGEGYYDWHDQMQSAINFFRRHPERPMVVPNPDSYWPGRYDGFGVGAGGQARFLCQILHEMGVEIHPIYLGKPYRPIYELAREVLTGRFGFAAPPPWSSLMMVGDSLQSDIRGGNALGMFTTLVLTGITGRSEAEAAAPECTPDLILPELD